MSKKVRLKNGEDIKIRHVKESDIDEVWRNFNEVVDEGIYLPVFFPVHSNFEKQSWYSTLKRNKELCIVAEVKRSRSKTEIIGQCEVSNLEWDAAAHVGNLGIIIREEYRNQGLGYQLIDYAIRESKILNDKKKIILSCFSNNDRALKLYERMGFKQVGIRKSQFYMDSQYHDEILMDLWIDDYITD
jgi:RimJ/RimL family protein N-acetyltransferase